MRTVYEIGPFRLEPQHGVLMRLGVAEPLGRRAVTVLSALVSNARRPMTKDAIIDVAWPGLVVEEANLSVQVSSIRRVLSQVPGGDRWIETLPRRGYRFVGPVVEVRDGMVHEATRVPGNLPEPVASFVGRERELVELKRLLGRNRIVTLVGMGGIGKTRLAVQLAAEVRDAYRDGAWFVDLAPLADPDLVASAAAQALDVPQVAGAPLVGALCRHLHGQRALLLVDNCEHVVDAAARMVEAILRSVAETTIVATSREPLRVDGEQLYWVPPLPLPDATAEREAIESSDAVTLFVDRAQHHQHDFTLTEAIAPAVARLCARLDGIPLALELAAPLVHAHSIDAIDRQLDDRFDTLTQGRRTALPRQQTLRATLEWSYELLSDEERTVLRAAAVFQGGLTTGAVTDVIADERLPSTRVEVVLAHLAARSLLLADPSDAQVRYRLLETTRAYALGKLEDLARMHAMQRRHAEHYRRVFDTAGDAWLRLAEGQWRALYMPELDNVRSALGWALGPDGDATLAIALAGGSGPMWTGLSLYDEGIEHLQAAVARLPSGASSAEVARLWLWLGLLLETAAPVRALAAFQHAVELYRELDDATGIAQACIWLARPMAILGRHQQSADALATALPALERARLPKLRAFYFANAGSLRTLANDFAGAQALHGAALALYREIGSAVGTAGSLNNAANASWALGDLEDAEHAFREAVAMHRDSGHRGRDPLGFTLANLAGVLTERGNLVEALEAFREAIPLLRSAANAWVLIDHLALRAALAGKLAIALEVAGFADAAHAAKDATRGPNEARARKRVDELSCDLDSATLARYLAEGSRMSEANACRLALEADARSRD